MNTLRIFTVALIVSTGLLFHAPPASAQQVSVSLSVFQNDLGRYGRWVNSPRFGQVWIYSEPGFRPYYTNGHWEYSPYGWAWVSDYEWGWGPFHYGRWEEDPYYGWIWIPGYEWAPAWVSWSEYGDNYGWAPLGFGLSVNISFGAIPYNRWTFVPRNYICSPHVHNYYINPGRNHGFRNAVVINNTYINNNVRFYAGPGRRDVERYTRSSIPVRNIEYGRPDRFARNDRSFGNERNDRFEGSGRIDRPQRNEMPDRRIESRQSNNLPERMTERNRGTERQVERAERPSFEGNDRQVERAQRPSFEGNQRAERTERMQRPSFEGTERSGPPSQQRTERSFPQRMERTAPVERAERQQQPRSQGGFGGMQRSPEVRQRSMERPERSGSSGRPERSDNGNRGRGRS